MRRACVKALAGLVLAAASLVSEGRSQAGGGESGESCPDEKVYTGEYRNWSYGFTVRIPAGLKGYWNSARCAKDDGGCVCMTDHGRAIPLGRDARLEVYTGFQTEPEWTVRDYEKNELAYLKKRAGVRRVEVVSSRAVRLGGLGGRRFVVRFFENGRKVISERVIVLHDGAEHSLSLRTTAGRYGADRRQFEKLVASWRLTPRVR